jgi:hypothetical protein
MDLGLAPAALRFGAWGVNTARDWTDSLFDRPAMRVPCPRLSLSILYLITCDHPLPPSLTQRELVGEHKDTPETRKCPIKNRLRNTARKK